MNPSQPSTPAERALEHMSSAVLLCDADGYIRYINGAAEVMFGVSARQVTGHRFHPNTTPCAGTLQGAAAQALNTGEPFTRRELVLEVAPERRVTVDLTVTPLSRSEALLEISDLSYGYAGTIIQRNVTFSVSQGEILFVVGRSGCGKSALLRNIIGLETPISGSVRFDGRDVTSEPPAVRRMLMRRIGILYQSGALWSTMTVAENVGLPLEEHTALSRAEIRTLVSIKLGMVGMAGSEGRYPAELSGGMRKRAALARALILDPEILFLDEPSAGLDPVSARNLDRLILETRESLGTTIVVVSHDLESICAVADRVVMLGRDERTVIANGRPRDLLREEGHPHVKEFFQAKAVGAAGEGRV